MIDWLTMEIPFSHTPIKSGIFLSITPDGEVDYQLEKKLSVIGSYDSSIRIRSTGSSEPTEEGVQASHIQIDGNPAKFLNGHNVVGSRDIINLTFQTVKKVFQSIDYLFIPTLQKTIESGDFKITRLDVNDYIQFNSESDTKAWMQACEQVATSRQGKFVRKGTTVYMGKHSRRCSLKIYSKYLELTQAKKGHKLPINLPHQQQLLDFCMNKLRVEATFRSLFLKDLGLNKAKDLTPQKIGELYAIQTGKIEMNAQVKLQPHEEFNLPRAVKLTYMCWKDGARLSEILPSNTFYRHRRILKNYGIDIKIMPTKIQSNVIPLIRKIEATQVEMPKWSAKKGLIFK